MSKPVIKKPEIEIDKLRIVVAEYYQECNASNPPKIYLAMEIAERVAQAQNDYCYKEILGEIHNWGNQRCLDHHTSMNNIVRRDCNECWQALSQLEE